jgi:hypothetical protein
MGLKRETILPLETKVSRDCFGGETMLLPSQFPATTLPRHSSKRIYFLFNFNRFPERTKHSESVGLHLE